jgi:hypothetical protein
MTGIFTRIKTLETREATQEVKSVLTRLLFNSLRPSSFNKLLDKERKANSRQTLEKKIIKTIKSPRIIKNRKQHRKVKV